MPGPVAHVNALAQCAHFGTVSITSTNTRVFVSFPSPAGSPVPVATMADQGLVKLCPFNVSGSPMPCVRVQWLVPATRVFVNGQPVLLQTTQGLGLNAMQAPQGTVAFAATQARVIAT